MSFSLLAFVTEIYKVMRPKIFNHDITIYIRESVFDTHSVLGNHLYCGRVLGLTESEDIIQLHPDLKSQWNAISFHYARIGLNHSKNVIWDVSLSVLADYPNYEISIYYFGDSTGQVSLEADGVSQFNSKWLKVAELMNSKNNFIQQAQELGISVPKTFCFENKAAIANLEKFPYPCYLKPAVSGFGAGIHHCVNKEQLTQVWQTLPDEVPLQIQEALTASAFLNLQYQVTEDGLKRLAATEQILNGYVHCGNRYPSTHQPWETTDPLAEWMVQQGMKGKFAFDVAVIEEEKKTRYFAIECNPRFNGSSYPTGMAEKLKLTSWSSETFTTHYRSLEKLDLSDIEFNPQTYTGIVLVNWGTILVGKVGILLAGSVEQQNELRSILKQRL
jgi:hypothetical protein